MLEYKVSKKDHRYFTWNGRHICSSYDPVKEASNWLDEFHGNVVPVKSLVILGLGNGFHAVDARKRYPSKNVVVIETNPDFVAPAEDLHGLDFHNIQVIVAETEAIFKSQSRLNSVMSDSYLVLPFQPVMNLDSAMFNKFNELLTGRTQESLLFQVQKRRKQHGLKMTQDSIVQSEDLLSIKEIESSVSESITGRQKHIIRALRELVI